MAFLFKFVHVFFLVVVFCFLVVVVLQQSSDSSTKVGCLYADTASQQIRNRKVLESKEEVKKVVFKRGAKVKRGNIGKKNVGWELRETPLGPDPLHHHGGTPNKPSNSP